MTTDAPNGPQDPVVTAKALTAALDKLRLQLISATKYGHRNRRMIWGLIISLALDVVLTIALTVLTIQVRDANDRAARVHDRQVATCESGNETRRAQRELWGYLLSLPPQRPLTKQQEQQRAQVKTYVNRIFTPRDCSRV